MGKIKIYDQGIRYEKVYRNIKYPRLEFKSGNLVLILPQNYENEKELLRKHKDWIYKKWSFIQRCLAIANDLPSSPNADLGDFKDSVNQIVKALSEELGVRTNKVFFRKMKTKWGSCSFKGNLTINTLLRFLPRIFISYVVLHEMAHRIHRKHTNGFHEIMKSRFINTEEMEEKLFAYWFLTRSYCE